MESDTAGYIEFFVPTPIYTSHVLRIAGPVNGIGRTAVAMRPTYASQALRLAGKFYSDQECFYSDPHLRKSCLTACRASERHWMYSCSDVAHLRKSGFTACRA